MFHFHFLYSFFDLGVVSPVLLLGDLVVARGVQHGHRGRGGRPRGRARVVQGDGRDGVTGGALKIVKNLILIYSYIKFFQKE